MAMTIDGDITGQFIADFISIFPHASNNDGRVVIDVVQTVTESLLEGLEKLTDKYKSLNVEIYKLRDFIKETGINNEFLIIPNVITEEQAQACELYMTTKSDPNPQKAINDIVNIKTQIDSNYVMYHQSGEKLVYIGESDKAKRVCRYCQRTMPEVTFKQKAHTISESLGNKTIVTNTECDECNNKYGSEIERDFANYHQFFRLFYNLKGKKEVGVSDANYVVTHVSDKNIKMGITLTKEQIKQMEDREARGETELILTLDTGQRYIPINIYKALCKYAIGILPDDVCANVVSTVKWMNAKLDFGSLPKVSYLFPTGFRLTNPRITTLIRKTDNNTLPFAIGIVEFTDAAYAFVIPTINDICDYSNASLWDNIWQALPLNKPTINWQLKDFFSIESKEAKAVVMFDISQTGDSKE